MKVLVWVSVATDSSDDDAKNLQQQKEDLLALCTNREWDVIDVLEVSTAPRFFLDYKTCISEMQKLGVDAFAKLSEHWDARNFDILVVRDKRRFLPSQSLFAYIVEKTLDSGAEIYSSLEGHITSDNYRIWLNMAGFNGFEQLSQLKDRRQRGVEARLRRGLPANANVPISHRIIRDEKTGKALRVELNPETEQMWQDLAQLILEGIAWKQIGRLMAERFGYINSNGKPYPINYFYRVVHNPGFWGHGAMGFKHQNFSSWVYDENSEAPRDVTLYRNIYDAVWTGAQAEEIVAELRKRESTNLAKKKPVARFIFDEIFLCAECGKPLKQGVEGMWTVWRCRQKHDNNISLKDRYARQYIEKRLRQMIEDDLPHALVGRKTPAKTMVAELKETQEMVDEILKSLERLLLKQAQTKDATMRETIEKTIHETYSHFQKVQSQQKDVWAKTGMLNDEQRQRAFENVKKSIETFWSMDANDINQILRDLLGNQRFIVANGDIIGIADTLE